MLKSIQQTAWYQRHIVPNFTKSVAWLASVFSFALAYGPDAAAFVLQHMDLLTEAVPTLSPGWKLVVLTIGHAVVFFGRPIRQDNMPQASVPVAVVNVPAVVDVPTGPGALVSVPTEIRVMDDGTRAAVAPPAVGGAVTFEQLVAHGRRVAGSLVDGMPWSFKFLGRNVTHENDQAYLISDAGEDLLFERGDTLWISAGNVLHLVKRPKASAA